MFTTLKQWHLVEENLWYLLSRFSFLWSTRIKWQTCHYSHVPQPVPPQTVKKPLGVGTGTKILLVFFAFWVTGEWATPAPTDTEHNATTDSVSIPVWCGSFTTGKRQDTVWYSSVLQLLHGCRSTRSSGLCKAFKANQTVFSRHLNILSGPTPTFTSSKFSATTDFEVMLTWYSE